MREIKKLPKLTRREPDTHKGNYGRVLVLAGSVGYTGAAHLCAKAALRTGSGLVTLGIPESLNTIMEVKLTCVMTHPLPETDERTLSYEGKQKVLDLSEDFDVIAIGPGLTTHPSTKRLVLWLLQMLDKPIVLDADGINAVDGDMYALERTRKQIVLTPHPGEMARLLGLPNAREVQKDRVKIAMRFAQNEGTVLVLKGHQTLVTDAERMYICTSGNPGMATAGSGDVLTGMIASLIGQGYGPFEAAQLAVYLHGKAGDLAARRRGEMAMIATDMLESLPRALMAFQIKQEKALRVKQREAGAQEQVQTE